MCSGVFFAIVRLEEDVVEMGAKAVVDETPTPMARATADILNLTMISVYYILLFICWNKESCTYVVAVKKWNKSSVLSTH